MADIQKGFYLGFLPCLPILYECLYAAIIGFLCLCREVTCWQLPILAMMPYTLTTYSFTRAARVSAWTLLQVKLPSAFHNITLTTYFFLSPFLEPQQHPINLTSHGQKFNKIGANQILLRRYLKYLS
jgi:hypothetical protein